jgi:hypothetical protein
VAANRGDETGDGTCQSDASADQPTTLGGEPAIAWSWRCPNSFHAAINTISHGMRLRLRVDVPLDAEQQAAAMLEDLRQGFAFVGDDGAPKDGTTVDLVELDQRLQGTYENDWHPVELQFAAIEAAGFSLDDADPDYLSTLEGVETTRTAVQFDGDKFIVYGAFDGGPLETLVIARYALVDDHTIEAYEVGSFTPAPFEFTLDNGILTMDVDATDLAGTGLFETLPFTRVP